MIKRAFCAVFLFCLSACTYLHIENATDGPPDGIRVYPSKLYLAVDTTKGQSTFFYAPDVKRAYDIKPVSIFAKHDFEVDMQDGQLTTVKSNQDSTDFLAFFQSVSSTAEKAAGLPVSSTNIPMTFGLASGLYVLDDTGNFSRLPIP